MLLTYMKARQSQNGVCRCMFVKTLSQQKKIETSNLIFRLRSPMGPNGKFGNKMHL